MLTSIMNWIRGIKPIPKPPPVPAPDVKGECPWRYPGGYQKCNRPLGHDDVHGVELHGLGLIVAPWPNDYPSAPSPFGE